MILGFGAPPRVAESRSRGKRTDRCGFILAGSRSESTYGIIHLTRIESAGYCMDVVYRLQGVEFERDDQKARLNVINHGVTFEEAAEVFFDPFYQYGDATPAGANEQRDFILGYSVAQRLLLVIYAERRERTRIISARLATRAERKLYESA